ncbi:MAG TPA: hypothetical protein VF779_11300 [Pyrinomonadaceae bacterium]
MSPSPSTLLLLTLAALLSFRAIEIKRFGLSPALTTPQGINMSGLLPQEDATEITKSNWQQHPKIKAIRAAVQAVKAGLTSKTFRIKRRAFEYCEPYEDTARTIATDSKGVVRFYQNEGGSDDSALKWEHYYDESGRLRFVFITGGAANGSKLEHRIYFDETGKRIWEEHVYKQGPGYTFPDVWPDEQLQIKDAAAKFASKSQCPEVKRKQK